MSLVIPVVIALIVAIVIAAQLFKSKNWSITEATITQMNTKEIYHSPNSAMSANKTTHSYQVNIEYDYHVSGKRYTGNKIYAGLPNILPSELEANNLIAQLKKDSKTRAYYNPKNPYQSALFIPKSGPGNTLVLIAIGIFALAFIGAGAFVITKI